MSIQVAQVNTPAIRRHLVTSRTGVVKAVVLALPLALAGCGDDTGEEMDEAAEEMGEAMEQAGEDARDAVERAGEEAKEAMDEAEEEIDGATQ